MASFKLAPRESADGGQGPSTSKPSTANAAPRPTCPSSSGSARPSASGCSPTAAIPYPVEVARTHTLAEIRRQHPDLAVDTKSGADRRRRGPRGVRQELRKALLRDAAGGRRHPAAGDDQPRRRRRESLDAWKSDVDLGDIVFVHGEVISSRRGELSVLADSWQIISKALRPLPVAHKEISEESRVRQRYVDLIVRPEARTIARQRIAVVRAVRSAYERRGFLEVETPILQTLAGGAAARPFVTHSNALDADLFLRIAPELFLKRCLVGGFEKVFELNRVFRNEGADSTHSPEFAMLETYQAYGTYDDSAVVTREIIQEVADEAIGTRNVPLPDGTTYDLDGEWATVEMYPSLSEALGEEITPETAADHLWAIADATWGRDSARSRVRARKARRGTLGARGGSDAVGAHLRP